MRKLGSRVHRRRTPTRGSPEGRCRLPNVCVVRSPDGKFFAMDGHCSHEKVHLADGIVDGVPNISAPSIIDLESHAPCRSVSTSKAIK